jgi:uncharacterized membrane protein
VRDERGQVSILVVGFFLVIALTVGVVVDASAAYLQRQGLSNLADAAALAAADGVKADQVYASHLDEPGPLYLAVARRYAAMYLRQVDADRRYAGLRVTVSSADGAVVVSLSAPLHLPVAPPDWDDKPEVTARAAAYVEVGD